LPARFGADIRTPPVTSDLLRARSSAGEHLVDIEGVTGSIPVAPTIQSSRTAETVIRAGTRVGINHKVRKAAQEHEDHAPK
jgi:hypothetical protein